MFFPIRTDRKLKRTPWVNYSLIALNVAVYAFTWQSSQQYSLFQSGGYSIQEIFHNAPGVGLWLWPDDTNIRLYQFITYQFVHSGPEPAPFLGIMLPLHLVFNMLFLYVFGNAVEDRMGKLGYLGFYLAAGVVAGLAHIQTGGGPVLGASGSVAAVTGIYLALFPMSNVTIAYWLVVFIGSFVVSSMVLIVFRVVLDIIFQLSGYGNTAYVAHLAGYLYGFVIGMGLLATRLLPREQYDMLALIEYKRRRGRARRAGQIVYTPPADGAPQLPDDQQQQVLEARARITAAAAADTPRAARLYGELLRDHPTQVMAQQTQLDLAAQLADDGQPDLATRAYELFLQQFPRYPQRAQVRLILGLIYANHLRQADRARELLTAVRPELDADNQALVDQALNQLR